MGGKFISIVGFGLIGDDKAKGPYRQIVFRDEQSSASAEIIVFQKEKPMLWEDVEKLEKGGRIPPYRGYITRYNTVDLVVMGDESLEDAFACQKWKLKLKGKLSFSEADRMREETMGYITNLTQKGSMEMGWTQLSKDIKLVKYRTYLGKGNFEWTTWYEID